MCYSHHLVLNPILISNPGIPYVGWLLLACAIIPSGEKKHRQWQSTGNCSKRTGQWQSTSNCSKRTGQWQSTSNCSKRTGQWQSTSNCSKRTGQWQSTSNCSKRTGQWHMPQLIYWSAWFLMALGYTISGLHKLQCPSWIDGSAMRHVLSSTLARDNFLRNFLLATPEIFLNLMTWFSLAAEILFLPLGLFYHIRKWYWLLIVGMQLSILCLINFTDLTLGVLMIHLFTFEMRWIGELF